MVILVVKVVFMVLVVVVMLEVVAVLAGSGRMTFYHMIYLISCPDLGGPGLVGRGC